MDSQTGLLGAGLGWPTMAGRTPGRRGFRKGMGVLAILSGAPLTGCTSTAPVGPPVAAAESPPPTAVETVFRGQIVHGHEVRTFQPCGSDTAVWASDPSGRLWTLHQELATGRAPYEAVFAVVRGRLEDPPAEGFGAAYARQLRVTGIDYVAGEGFGCEFDWSGFGFRASGNEPFWSVVVSEGGVRLSRPGAGEEPWAELETRTGGPVREYRGILGDGQPVELRILPGSCRDSMSGAYFGWSAELRLGADALRGCALPGDESDRLADG